MPEPMELRCYCCGEGLGERFALAAAGTGSVDRVFLVKLEHVRRLDGEGVRTQEVSRG